MKAFFLLAELNIGNTAVNPMAKVSTLGPVINFLSQAAILGAVLIFGGMLLMSAYKILTAGGNAEQVVEGQRMITFAVLGIIIVFLAYLIVNGIGYVLNVDIPI